MIQLRFLGMDFRRNYLKFLFSCIQFIAVMFLFTYVINVIDVATKVETQMKAMKEEMNIYILEDLTESYKFGELVQDNQYYSKMIELEQYIKQLSQMNRYTIDSSLKIQLENTVKVPVEAILSEHHHIYEIEQVLVSSNFFQIFKLKGDFDNEEIVNIFSIPTLINGNVPIVLGSNYKSIYSNGDVIIDEQMKNYEVVGFFEKDSYYIDPYRELKLFYLDSAIVAPCDLSDGSAMNFTFQFLASYFYTNNSEDMEKIVKKSNSLGLFNLKVRSFSKQLGLISQDKTETVIFNATLAMLILIMSIMGLLGNVSQFIVDNIYEFSVHLLCGAREINIILRVAMQIILITFVANLVNLGIYRFNNASMITMYGSVFLAFLLLIYPIKSIYSKNIMTLIRRYSN